MVVEAKGLKGIGSKGKDGIVEVGDSFKRLTEDMQ
jgi:hypothetical protein